MPFTIISSAFEHEGAIPRLYTADGKDLSPPLEWRDPPEGTRQFALICDDPDAPGGTWVHWVVYGLPPSVTSLPQGQRGQPLNLAAVGVLEGRNSFGTLCYGGPAPPPGHGPHHYHFKIYALEQPLQLTAGATKRDLLTSMEEDILGYAELVGVYERKGTGSDMGD